MKIAQVAPLFESVPPQTYGGTERVVSYLTEELVRQGHEVTLFASGDSVTQASLVPIVERSLRLNPKPVDPWPFQLLQIEAVQKLRREFDVIHFHTDYLHFPTSRASDIAQLTTLHGRLDLPELGPLYQEFTDMPLVSISDNQRTPLPMANWIRTVYHGLPEHHLMPVYTPGKYLAFLGRISPEKRVDRAIEIAKCSGLPLKIAAKVDKADAQYYAEIIEPLIRKSPHVDFIGEIGDDEKQLFLGGAIALLFPIDWPEPFGLVMIEAMACGTPVVAYKRGSVSEIIDPGRNGFTVTSIEEAVSAVDQIGLISRQNCRQAFLERFTARRMAHDYVEQYGRVRAEKIDRNRSRVRRRDSGSQPVLRTSEFFAQHPTDTSFKTAG